MAICRWNATVPLSAALLKPSTLTTWLPDLPICASERSRASGTPCQGPEIPKRRLLKSWRNRYENILFELPKQVMPYSQLHFNVMRGWADGIRESVLLARAFGMTKEQVYEPLFSPMVNTGPEAYTIVSQAAGDVLAADWT